MARKTCCLVSEILEEVGLDRAKARALRRQLLEGIILLCRWQLERIDDTVAERAPSTPAARGSARRGPRRVTVE